jgi:hypothetical protein
MRFPRDKRDEIRSKPGRFGLTRSVDAPERNAALFLLIKCKIFTVSESQPRVGHWTKISIYIENFSLSVYKKIIPHIIRSRDRCRQDVAHVAIFPP